MPSIRDWAGKISLNLNWKDEIEGDNRSVTATHRFILEKPSSIIVERGASTTLSAQTVRIEQTRIAPDINVGPGGREYRANATLIGYKGHPTIADTDLLSGDRFIHDSTRFLVRMIFPETEGRLEAWLEVVE